MTSRSISFAYLILGRVAGYETDVSERSIAGWRKHRDDVMTGMRILHHKFPDRIRIVVDRDSTWHLKVIS